MKATIEDNTGSGVVGRHARQRSHWTRPSEGWVKCNVDGSFIQNSLPSQAGWIYRDNRGTYRGVVQAMGGQVQNPLECELQAILMAIQHSWSLGYQKVIVESDCKKAIDILTSKTLHFGLYNWIREIKWWCQRIEAVQFKWINREANRVADKLAISSVQNVSFIFHSYVPNIVTHLLHEDYIWSQD